MKYWILTGTTDSWKISLEKNIWGINEKLKDSWDKVQNKDYVFFYVKYPISGIIGYGNIVNKYQDNIPIWGVESKSDGVFPYRFIFKVKYVLPKDIWKSDKIEISNIGLNYRKGINSCINKDGIKELRNKITLI